MGLKAEKRVCEARGEKTEFFTTCCPAIDEDLFNNKSEGVSREWGRLTNEKPP